MLNDNLFMSHALAQAQKAYEKQEVPIGAIIVNPQGKIIARAHNQVEKLRCQLAHAELLAIKKACAQVGDWRLTDHWLYVTLEPCSMCMHAIIISRIAGVVYGASSPLFGYRLDNLDPFVVQKKITVVKGVCEQEAAAMLKRFFKSQRKLKSE